MFCGRDGSREFAEIRCVQRGREGEFVGQNHIPRVYECLKVTRITDMTNKTNPPSSDCGS
eukprot:949384-Amphidinium_carterae.1